MSPQEPRAFTSLWQRLEGPQLPVVQPPSRRRWADRPGCACSGSHGAPQCRGDTAAGHPTIRGPQRSTNAGGSGQRPRSALRTPDRHCLPPSRWDLHSPARPRCLGQGSSSAGRAAASRGRCRTAAPCSSGTCRAPTGPGRAEPSAATGVPRVRCGSAPGVLRHPGPLYGAYFSYQKPLVQEGPR